jgi:hypothetical protein
MRARQRRRTVRKRILWHFLNLIGHYPISRAAVVTESDYMLSPLIAAYGLQIAVATGETSFAQGLGKGYLAVLCWNARFLITWNP